MGLYIRKRCIAAGALLFGFLLSLQIGNQTYFTCTQTTVGKPYIRAAAERSLHHNTPRPTQYNRSPGGRNGNGRSRTVHSDLDLQNQEQIISLYRDICRVHGTDLQIEQPEFQFKSIVLVVIFNFPMYQLVPLLELVYRPLFPRIVYCIPDGEMSSELKNWNVTVVVYDNDPERPGFYNYICVHYVHLLGLNADGFLFLADDLIISPSVVADFSMSAPATPQNLATACSVHKPTNSCKSWPHYQMGSMQWSSLVQDVAKEAENSLAQRCTQALRNMTGLKDPYFHDNGDVYFIPSAFMADASEMFRKSHNHHVFMEVAVVNVLRCISWPTHPVHLDGDMKWNYDDRHEFYRFLPEFISSGKKQFLHPVKLGAVLHSNETKSRQAFCQNLLPFQHRKLSN